MQPPLEPKEGLAEVERALSVLQGRHPELERVNREEAERAAMRNADRNREAAAEVRTLMLRHAKQVAATVAGLAVAGIVGTLFARELARRGHIESSSDAYRAMGFTVVDTSSRSAPGRLDASVDNACFIGASTDLAPIEAKLGDQAFSGATPIAFCTCESAKVELKSNVKAGGGLTLLRIEPAMIGGSAAFAFAPFVAGGSSRKTDDACADRYLDAWIAARHAPALAPDDAWLRANAKGAAFAASGARVLGKLSATKPFAMLETPASTCLVAISSVPTDMLSIRVTGGTTLVTNAPGSFAWCSSGCTQGTIHRDGAGDVTLLAFRADTIGGLLGVREVAKRAGITLGVAGLPAIDHAWNAKAILVASAVPEPLLTTASTPDIPPDLDARVVAVSFATKNAIVADLPGGTFSYCNPSLEDRAGEALCVFSGAQTWRTMGADAVGAVARAKLPFWLFGLGGVNDPVAMKLATQLATLARRLKQDGFEPTTADAITETPHGVEILGRSNEDAIVAVGLMASAPFVFPYADGPAWTLDGQPRIIQLEPTRTLALPASVRPLPSKDKRRTVVFRHAVH